MYDIDRRREPAALSNGVNRHKSCAIIALCLDETGFRKYIQDQIINDLIEHYYYKSNTNHSFKYKI
jgi:hypothetical protein